MKTLIRYTTVFFLLMTSACAGGSDHAVSYNGNWDTMKYSDFAAIDTSGLLRMGK